MTPITAAWLERLRPEEGGYSADPLDAGGETNFGITIFTARAFGYTGSMKALTWDQAKLIYEARYVVQPQFDLLAAIDAQLAWKLFDIGVNMGQAVGGKFLQRALNILNLNQADYPDLIVDGSCGAMTRAAVKAFYAKRGPEGRKVLLSMVMAQHSVRYIEICEAKPTNERFAYGWEHSRAMLMPA
jgi:lysozyme family protein